MLCMKLCSGALSLMCGSCRQSLSAMCGRAKGLNLQPLAVCSQDLPVEQRDLGWA